MKSYAHKKVWELEIEELKKILDAENYIQYTDFKRNALDIAVRETNEFGDVVVSYELEKTGRRLTRIRFKIAPKKHMDERMKAWKKIEERLAQTVKA